MDFRNRILIISALLVVFACDKLGKSESQNDLSLGKKIVIESKILGEEREIWVHVPDGGPAAQYPVLYLMDGSAHFYSVVGLMHQFSDVNGNDIAPKMIVVGIANTDRTRDLTPTHVPPKDSAQQWSATSGGGEKFLDFIEQELIPHIAEHYPATSERTLVGHSLGGLMVIHALINRPSLFSKYISVDPSLWWDQQKSLKQYQEALREKEFKDKALFVGIANTIGTDTLIAMADTTPGTSHFRSIMQFVKTLKQTKSNGLDWNAKYYPEDTHGSVPLITEMDAFHYLFRKTQFPMDVAGLTRFEGRYKNKGNIIEIARKNQVLLVSGSWDGKPMQFVPISPNSLYSFTDRFTLSFTGDGNGPFRQMTAFDEVYVRF